MTGAVLALTAASSFALANLFLNRALKTVASDVTTFWTLLINYALFGIGVAVETAGDALPPIHLLGAIAFALSGLFGAVLGRWCNVRAIQGLGPTRAAGLKVTTPMFTLVFAVAALGERPATASLVGVMMVLIGLVLFRGMGLPQTSSARTRTRHIDPGGEHDSDVAPAVRPRQIMSPLTIGLASALFYSIGDVFRKVGIGFVPSPALGNLIGTSVALVVFLVKFALQKSLRSVVRVENAVFPLLGAGVAMTVAMWSFLSSLVWIPLSVAAALTATEPLITAGLSAVLLKHGEVLSPTGLTAIALIVTGAVTIVLASS